MMRVVTWLVPGKITGNLISNGSEAFVRRLPISQFGLMSFGYLKWVTETLSQEVTSFFITFVRIPGQETFYDLVGFVGGILAQKVQFILL